MSKCKCDNCEWSGEADSSLPIKSLSLRVAPGDTMPAGECPECMALCFSVKAPLDQLPGGVTHVDLKPAPIGYRCSECGSEDVTYDAIVRWNVEAQDWEYSSLLDSSDCCDCGEENCLEEFTPG